MSLDDKNLELHVKVLYDDDSLKQLETDLDKAKRSAGGLGDELDKTSKKSVKSATGFGKLGKGTASIGNDFKKIGGTLLRVGQGFAILGAAGIAAVAAVGIGLKKLLDIGVATQNGIKQTEQVIKSTGGAAGVSAKHIDKLTNSLMNKSGIDDDIIRTGANMLLTFKNIKNEVGEGKDMFDQATLAALDMSVVMGGDIQGAAIRMGKALNDPIAGMAALSRVGVQFTEDQKGVITKLQESGDMAGAQAFMLKELNSQLGGQAEKQMQPTVRLKNIIGNLSEEIGMSLIPNADRGAIAIGDMVAKMTNQFVAGEGVMGDFKANLKRLTNFVATFFEDMSKGVGAGGEFRDFLTDSTKSLFKFINEMKAGEGQGGKTRESIKGFIDMLKNLTTVLIAALPIIQLFGTLASGLLIIFSQLSSTMQTMIIGFFAATKILFIVNNAIKAMGMASMFAGISMGAAALAALPWIAAILAIVGVAVLFYKNWDKVKEYAASNWKFLKKIFLDGTGFIAKYLKIGFMAPVNWIKSAWTGLKNFFSNTWNFIKNAFNTVVNVIVTLAKHGFLGPIPLILARWGKIKKFFMGLPKAIVRFLSGLGKKVASPFVWAYNKISYVLDKIIGSFEAAIGKIKSVVSGIGDLAGDAGGILGFAEGGRVGPDSGGPRMFMAGEGNKDEWVISQEGNRKKNQGYAIQAAKAVGIDFFANGGKVRGGETRLARAELTPSLKDDLAAAIQLRNIYKSSVSLLDKKLKKNRKGKDYFDRKFSDNPKKARTARNTAKDSLLSDLGSFSSYKEMVKTLKQNMKGVTSETSQNYSEQISAFNSERFNLLSSFVSNVRSSSNNVNNTPAAFAQNNQNSKQGAGKPDVYITQNYTEPPRDPHSWTRNIQNEITATV